MMPIKMNDHLRARHGGGERVGSESVALDQFDPWMAVEGSPSFGVAHQETHRVAEGKQFSDHSYPQIQCRL